MSHITEITLENYRSFVKASCRLSPFTLIVGANNAGKTNLLRAIQDVAEYTRQRSVDAGWWKERCHHARSDARPDVELRWSEGKKSSTKLKTARAITDLLGSPNTLSSPPTPGEADDPMPSPFNTPLHIAQFDPAMIGGPEGGDGVPLIQTNGTGVSWMLDTWNAGVRAQKEHFDRVEADLRRCVPEIDRLSFYNIAAGKRAIQVEQHGLPVAVPLSEVSDGTRLILAILTLINLETLPPVLLLEDIDRGLHPRLYEQLVEFLRTLARTGRTQILATSHDPYLIDEFRDTPEAVVIVEKKEGASTLSNLDDRLKTMLEPGEELEMPLGQVWFSGLVGGVPNMKLPEILKPAMR